MQFALAHWNIIAAVVGAVAVLVWMFWPSISKLRLPSGGTTEASTPLKSDLDSLLGILQRAKERAKKPEALLPIATADCLSHAVESLVKELTA